MRCAIAAAPVEVGSQEIAVRISAGIAEHRVGSGVAEAAEEFIRRADRALYAAERRGRDRIEVAP